MSSSSNELRCTGCDALLAKRERGGFSIRRGPMQTAVTGDFTIAVTCYRCGALNVATSRPPTTPSPAAEAAA